MNNKYLKKLKTALFVILSIVSTIPSRSHATLSETQNIRIQSLAGRQTQHSGPNCFNSVSFVSGFTDFLYQTSSAELKYYLSQYCQENKSVPQAGDILIMGVPSEPFESSLAHALIVLENSTIFEKGATTGRFSFATDSADYQRNLNNTYYAVRNYQDSAFADTCSRQNPNCRYYSCNKRPSATCASGSYYDDIKAIQKQLENLSLSNKEDVSQETKVLFDNVVNGITKFKSLNPAGACSVYYFTMWKSISWHIYYNSPARIDHEVFSTLDKILESLRIDILENQKDPTTKFILSE